MTFPLLATLAALTLMGQSMCFWVTQPYYVARRGNMVSAVLLVAVIVAIWS